MTRDTKAIISTMGGIAVVLGGFLINQNAQLNMRIGDLREEMNTRFTDLDRDIANLRTDVRGDITDLRTDVRGMGERLRKVEIEFRKVDQRLLTLERAILPAAESDE